MKTTILGRDSEENAYIIKDYPFGFKRTEQKRWIETNPKHGQRLCIKTKNPKTGRWCATKKETYSWIVVLYIDNATGHVHTDSLSKYTSTDEAIVTKFKQDYDLSEYQTAEVDAWLIKLKAYNEKLSQQVAP